MPGNKLPETLAFWHPATLIATWFGAGLLPFAPGTWGSLAALPCAWLAVHEFGLPGLAAAVAAVFLAGWWASCEILARIGDDGAGGKKDDPGFVVVDEVAGQGLTLLFVPLDLTLYLVGFLFFRLFDTLKPWPVNLAERHLRGGIAIMADDIAAGFFAGISMYIFLHLKQWIDGVF